MSRFDNSTSKALTIELPKKKDKTLPIVIGSVLTIVSFFMINWITALIIFVLTIGYSLRSYNVNCPSCSHKNSVYNHSNNITCAKCKSLTIINWIE